jgi:uncharacterized membrane protein
MNMIPLILAGIAGLAAGAAAILWILSKAPNVRMPLGLVMGLMLIAQFLISAGAGSSRQDVGLALTVTGLGSPDQVWGYAAKVFLSAFLMGGLVMVTRRQWSERIVGMAITGIFALPFYMLNVTMVGVSATASAGAW